MLTKATADDETPVPGYLYQEINSILLNDVVEAWFNDR
jgi:hypothetical protein